MVKVWRPNKPEDEVVGYEEEAEEDSPASKLRGSTFQSALTQGCEGSVRK
jgi:hypothetical protein